MKERCKWAYLYEDRWIRCRLANGHLTGHDFYKGQVIRMSQSPRRETKK